MSGAHSGTEAERRGAFTSRRVFILAAIGSAVGLGNIWRFPYVAYENGGGAFLIPYLVALLTAGLPFLLLDYATATATAARRRSASHAWAGAPRCWVGGRSRSASSSPSTTRP